MFVWLKRLLILLILLVGFLLGALSVNQEEIPLRFAMWQTEQAFPAFFYMLGTFLVGTLFGLIGILMVRVRYGLQLRRATREVTRLSTELESMRTASVQSLDQADAARDDQQARALPAPTGS